MIMQRKKFDLQMFGNLLELKLGDYTTELPIQNTKGRIGIKLEDNIIKLSLPNFNAILIKNFVLDNQIDNNLNQVTFKFKQKKLNQSSNPLEPNTKAQKNAITFSTPNYSSIRGILKPNLNEIWLLLEGGCK